MLLELPHQCQQPNRRRPAQPDVESLEMVIGSLIVSSELRAILITRGSRALVGDLSAKGEVSLTPIARRFLRASRSRTIEELACEVLRWRSGTGVMLRFRERGRKVEMPVTTASDSIVMTLGALADERRPW